MKRRSDRRSNIPNWEDQRRKIIGLGERSIRKSYYPSLKARLDDVELLRTLIDWVGEGVFLLRGDDLGVIDANATACVMLGAGLNGIKGKSVLEILPRKAGRALGRIVPASFRGGKKLPKVETEIERKGPGKMPVEIDLRPVEVAGANYYIMMVTNVTERKDYEERLKKSEAMFRMIADYSYDIEVFTAEDGTINYINPELKRLTGKSPSNFIGKSVFSMDIFSGKDRETSARYAKEILRGKALNDQELCVNDASGEKRYVSVSGQAVRNKKGDVIGARIGIRDITKRKKDDLVKTSLLGDIAHSINNPLASVRGALDLLDEALRKNDKKKIDAIYPIIKRNLFLINENINSLMMIYSLDHEKIKRLKKKISLNKVLGEVLESLREKIGEKGITVFTDINKRADEVFFVERQMYAVLWNLIANSIKFTEKGFVRVTARLDGKNSVIQVEDTGCGIEKKDLKKIFDMFYRRAELSEGTGLGLSIVKSIVDMYQGTIRAFSDGPGKGATMSISIPRNKGR